MRSLLHFVSLLGLVASAALPKCQSQARAIAKSAVTNTDALRWYNSNLASGTSGRSNPSGGYVCFTGPASNFPPMSSWISFNNMWALQKADALQPIGDNSSEIQAVYDGIMSVSQTAKVDPRVILGVIIEESTGNVRVKCTNNGVENCGLMQSYAPTDQTYDPTHYQTSIKQMIVDGTQGTQAGPGLVQLFNNAALTQGNVYAVLRAYNSGKINASNLSDGKGATSAYVSNVANYLQGWNGWGAGPSACNF